MHLNTNPALLHSSSLTSQLTCFNALLKSYTDIQSGVSCDLNVQLGAAELDKAHVSHARSIASQKRQMPDCKSFSAGADREFVHHTAPVPVETCPVLWFCSAKDTAAMLRRWPSQIGPEHLVVQR